MKKPSKPSTKPTGRPKLMQSRALLDELQSVQDVRSVNNFLWMAILRVALNADPTTTKQILKRINGNDAAITKILRKIADAD